MSDQTSFCVAHLTTVDMSLRFLVAPQLRAVVDVGGESVGISSPGPWVDDVEAMGVRHIPLASSTRGVSVVADIKATWEFWRVLRQLRPTVLHTHNPKPGLYGRVLGRLAGVPLVVNTVHGLYATRDDPIAKQAIVYLLEGIASRFSDIELFQNPEDLAFARSIGVVSRAKSSLLGNGVDLSRFDPDDVDPADRARLREELGADDSTIVVGVVGRLVAEKGLPELFEAARRLDEGYRIVVVGPADPDKPDALSPELIERAESDGVLFLGMRDDVKALYSAMDIFVLPSHREGFPRAAMEAAAMGLPVIATDIRGCRQVVDHEVNGVLVPVRSADGLHEAIDRLGSDEALRYAMGEASRSKARAEFDESRVVEIVMSAYLRGLESKGRDDLLPEAMRAVHGPTRTRRATSDDVVGLADMHVNGIATGFLPRLGRRFMRVLYSAMVGSAGSVVLVAEDDAGITGFVSGTIDTGAFYKEFLRSHWLRAVVAMFPRVLLPSNLRRVWETLRYGDDGGEGPEAELLAMSVVPRARRRGLGLDLGVRFLAEMSTLGADSVRVVVGSENEAAIAAYRRMGFEPFAQIEVHAGETSEVLVWTG